MDQAPNYYHNYMPTQFDPPPQQYMGEQFQQQYHGDYNNLHEHEQRQPAVDPFMDAVNAEVWAAVQAYHSKDAKSLHLAYANIGFVLGVDKACTYFVRSYSSANPSYGGAHSRRTAKLFFKKDWENLEAMVAADIDNEKKIVHVEEFMKRRRIPGYVSLHAPKQIVCDKLQVKQEQISRVDDACHTRDEVMRLDVACQTRDESTISLNVACQTEKFRSLEASCQTERFVSLETSCQTECLVSLDIARQTVDKSAGLSISCQTTDRCDKSSQTSVDKAAVRKDSDNRKRAHDDEQDSRSTKRSKHSDSSRKSNDEIVHKGSSDNCKRAREDKSETCSTNRSASRSKHSDSKCSSQKRESVKSSTSKTHAVDSKKSSRESSDKKVPKDSSDNYKYVRGDKSETSSTDRSESHAKRSNSKDSEQKCEATKSSASKNVSRQTTDAVDSKKSSRDSAVTSKVLNDHIDGGEVAETRSSSDCKENSGSYGCHVTMLVIQNLHPLVNDADISTIFSVFKSYKSSKVNSHNYDKMGVAGVVFEEEADAQEAKKQFDGKKLDGYPMHIVVVKSEKN